MGLLPTAPLAPVRAVEAGSVAVVVDFARDEMPDSGSCSGSESSSMDSATSSSSDSDSSASSASSSSSSSPASPVVGPSSRPGAGDSASSDTDKEDDEADDTAAAEAAAVQATEQVAYQETLVRTWKDTSLTKEQRLVGHNLGKDGEAAQQARIRVAALCRDDSVSCFVCAVAYCHSLA